MKVICTTKGDPGEFLIFATGAEMTALEEAVYRRNIQLQEHEGRKITGVSPDRHAVLLVRMLDALRRPFVADQES